MAVFTQSDFHKPKQLRLLQMYVFNMTHWTCLTMSLLCQQQLGIMYCFFAETIKLEAMMFLVEKPLARVHHEIFSFNMVYRRVCRR